MREDRGAGAVADADPDGFLREVSGVVHVGANTGQERALYAGLGLRVLWVEPIPEVFETLLANLRGYREQRALRCLVSDSDGAEYQFHVASNRGASSSILDLKLHREVWPHVSYERTIRLRSRTLASLLAEERIGPGTYDALVVDTQGAELLVLRGALPILRHFAYIKVEVPDFESYAGCCQLGDVASFLAEHGYREHSRRTFAKRAAGGSYYDVVYKRTP